MRIGDLAKLLGGISYRVTLEDNPTVPPLDAEGNPFCDQLLTVKWSKMWDMGLDVHLHLPKACLVDRLCVTFGERTKLFSARLLDGATGLVLSSVQGETGQTIQKRELCLEAAGSYSHLILRLVSDLSYVDILSARLYGAVEEKPDLFPTPNALQLGEGFVKASCLSTFASSTPLAQKAEAVWKEKLWEVAQVACEKKESGFVTFVFKEGLGDNAYEVKIEAEGVWLSAKDERGFVIAVETLLKLITDGRLPVATVEDSPAFPFRGFHMYLPGEEEMEFSRRLVKYLLSPLGYNAVIIEVAGGLRFDSHPEISEAFAEGVRKGKCGELPRFPHGGVAAGKPISKALAREFADYIRSFGIAVIPEVQSLGHVQFMTFAHPEIAEIPVEVEQLSEDERSEDIRPERIYPHCYCPSNEKSYEILFDLMEEIIDTFRPDGYVHIGHDEVYEIGVCKVCREKDPAQLFADDVNRLYRYLKERGYKTMMWADMLQPVTKYRTPPAITKIPKDIFLLDFIWYFHFDKDIEDNLLKEGFSVGVGNLYSSHFPRYLSRMSKKGMQGGQISGWVGMNPIAQATEGKFFDYLLTAQMLWSKDYRPEYTDVYTAMIRPMLPSLREKLENFSFPSKSKGAQELSFLEQEIPLPPVKGAALQTEAAIGQKLSSVAVSTTMLRKITRKPWTDFETVGAIELCYEDGTVVSEALAVGKNVYHWNRHQFDRFEHQLYRHNGYTTVYYCEGEDGHLPTGEKTCFYRVELLTDPNKILSSVRITELCHKDARLALKSVKGYR